MGWGKPKPAVCHQNDLHHVRGVEGVHIRNTVWFQLKDYDVTLLKER
jgi:hypothetical protein